MSQSFSLVQVSKQRGRILRVRPEDAPPVVELSLEDNQRLLSMDIKRSRITENYSWVAYVETRT